MGNPAHSVWSDGAPLFAGGLLNPEQELPGDLTSSRSGNDAARYAVYRNNVTVGLVRAMEANFPSIVRLLGTEYFAGLARLFVRHHPPQTRLLFEYGSEFAAFLETFEPLAAYPYLGDVARIEQAWRDAFHEEDAAVLGTTALSSVPPDAVANLCFLPHPAVRVIQSRYAAGTIFVANRRAGEASGIDPLMPEIVLVTRPEFDCAVRILDLAQGKFAQMLLDGKPLGEAASAAFEIDGSFDLAGSISGFVGAGAFAGYTIMEREQQ